MTVNIEEWKDRIYRGARWRDHVAKTSSWSRYSAYWRHKWSYSAVRQADILPLNVVYEIGSTLLAQLFQGNLSVLLTPLRPGHDVYANLLERVVNVLMSQIQLKKVLRDAAKSSYLYGAGFLFTGYDTYYGLDTELLDPAMPDSTLTQFNDKSGERLEYDSNVMLGMPWVKHINSRDIIFPSGTTHYTNTPWVAIRTYRTLKDIKADRRYSYRPASGGNRDSIGMGSNISMYSSHKQTFGYDDPDDEWIELWHIHDKKTGMFSVIDMGSPKRLMHVEDTYQFDGRLPISAVIFEDDEDHPYGIPIVRYIEPQQLEINDTRTQAQKHRRASVAKLLCQKNGLDREEVDKFLSANVQPLIWTNGDPNEIVKEFRPSVPADLLVGVVEAMRKDIREITGISVNQAGQHLGKTHISSTESSLVSQANAIRVSQKRETIVDACKDVLENILAIIYKTWTVPKVQDIIGPDGARWWIEYVGTDLESDYVLKVDIADEIPATPQQRRQNGIELLGVLSKANPSGIIPPTVLRAVLRNYPEINANIDVVMSEVAQQQQITQMMSLMEAQKKSNGEAQRVEEEQNAPIG